MQSSLSTKMIKMKKIFFLAIVFTYSLQSCFVGRMFHPKYGCPTSGAAIGAERIAAGDQKAIRASNRSKYKGEKKIY